MPRPSKTSAFGASSKATYYSLSACYLKTFWQPCIKILCKLGGGWRLVKWIYQALFFFTLEPKKQKSNKKKNNAWSQVNVRCRTRYILCQATSEHIPKIYRSVTEERCWNFWGLCRAKNLVETYFVDSLYKVFMEISRRPFLFLIFPKEYRVFTECLAVSPWIIVFLLSMVSRHFIDWCY